MRNSFHSSALEIAIQKRLVAFEGQINPHLFRVNEKAMLSEVADDIVVRLVGYLAANQIHREVLRTESVPESWWDGFKTAWFPRWALVRWPARYRSIDCEVQYVHMCPHLSLPDDSRAHIMFLARPEDLRRYHR